MLTQLVQLHVVEGCVKSLSEDKIFTTHICCGKVYGFLQ